MPSDRRLGFPPSARLKRRADYQKVYQRGVRVTGRYVVLFFLHSGEREGRFGVTATRKIGCAVVRNRAKRRLRELYRLRLRNDAAPVCDIVANARRSSATAPWAELERDFMSCLEQGRRLIAGHVSGVAPAREE